MRQLRLGLALGGGGARGFAHLGVLQALENLNIHPEIIAGSSIGALVGALYVRYGTAAQVEDALMALVESEPFRKLGFHLINVKSRGGSTFWHQAAATIQDRIIINLAHSKPGLVRLDRFRDALEYVITNNIWGNGKRRLGVVATDLYNGEDVYFTEGELLPAVMASMSIPGFLPPVEINGRMLVDGGVSQQVPIRLAKEMGADFVLAVDVGQTIAPITELDNAMAIMTQSDNIKSCHYRKLLNREADVLVRPLMPGVHWSAFDQGKDFVQIGRAAFEENKDFFLKALYKKRHPVLGNLKQLLSL